MEQIHNQFKLGNNQFAVQIRPAENHRERENKIFVGMLPKSFGETELHDLFSGFGELKEVTELRSF